jgi:hypothetical protein
MRVRFFGSLAFFLIRRASPVLCRMFAPAVDAALYTILLPLWATVFFLLVRCFRAMFTALLLLAVFRNITEFVTFKTLANSDNSIIRLAVENFRIL